jgi:hypothetical protein
MMDKSKLAELMLEYEKMKKRLDEYKQAISDAVLQMQESVTAGNVTAKYYNGRKSYDYKAVTGMAPDELVQEYTKTTVRVDHRKLALDGLGIAKEDIPYTQGDPRVSLKVK